MQAFMPPPVVEATATLEEALSRHFGHAAFRPGQEAVIRSVISARPTLAVLPTGHGKSLCYQLPAMVLPGVTLVVSPLVALMKDQVDALEARGLPATLINSTLDEGERNRRIGAMRAGKYKLVYVAPERFRAAGFLAALAEVPVALFAVDEAHCASQWGHDFRPDYAQLGEIRAKLAPQRTLALTATATPEVRKDILRILGLDDAAVFMAGFDRPNLALEVVKVGGAEDKVAKIGALARAGAGIVYAATRKNAERYAELLAAHGVHALCYHAGLPDEERHRVQDAFLASPDAVVVATNAFGMGVDKPDVRFVAHAEVPRTVEAYYQEVGRAGRDGAPARAVLLFNHADVFLQERMLEGSHPRRDQIEAVWEALVAGRSPHTLLGAQRLSTFAADTALRLLERAGHLARTPAGHDLRTPKLPAARLAIDWERWDERGRHEKALLARMVRYAYSERCRRAYVLRYFGDPAAPAECGSCDVCSGPSADLEAATQVKSRRGRASWVAEPGSTFDPALFDAMKAWRRGRASAQGVAAYVVFPDKTLAAIATARPRTPEELMAIPGVGPSRCEKYGAEVLALVARSRELDGEAPLPGAAPRPKAAPAEEPALQPEEAARFEALRIWRRGVASEAGLPPYVVFHDRTLRAIARANPKSRAELAGVPGLGPAKLERYGEGVLGALAPTA